MNSKKLRHWKKARWQWTIATMAISQFGLKVSDQRAQQNYRFGQHSPKKVQHDAGNPVTFQEANNLTNANC